MDLGSRSEVISSGNSDQETASSQVVIQERREGLYQRLLNGASGAEIVQAFTDVVDAVLIGRYRNVIRRESAEAAGGFQQCCLVAVGGYGRRELAPYSDIDVMLLFGAGGGKVVSSLSSQVFYHLWDLGFQVGHSVRSIQDCLSVAGEDLSAKTALMESRFLAGNPGVFHDFKRRFGRTVLGRRTKSYVEEKVVERQREYAKFGETVYLLEPNIKKTKGGLRDLHLLQWIGMARYQASTLQELADRGILAYQDYLALAEAREFLWRVRAHMHLYAGRAQEILSFEEQVRLAAQFGYADQPHLLAVEQFMQQYYQYTTDIHDRCLRFIDRSREGAWWRRLFQIWPSSLIDGAFRISNNRLTIPAEKLMQVLEDSDSLLRLFQLAQEKRLPIDTPILEEIHRHLDGMPDAAFRNPAVNHRFRQILSGSGPVADTLEMMHRARLLEKFIPAFSRVRGLMQFNQYHKYTVDEHSLLAVRVCEHLGQGSGMFGEVYREIRHKDLLHLALLLHDLGKGLPEDHSEVGKAIAQEMVQRLGLDPQEARSLEFLVYRHLLMSNTAFRRDPYDDKVILNFARAVGTPEVLRKLYMLTAADLAAVGPDSLTKWKEALLTELYLRTLPEVSGGRETVGDREKLQRIAKEVMRIVTQRTAALQANRTTDGIDTPPLKWIESQLSAFPSRYWLGTPKARMADHLMAIRQLQHGEPIMKSEFNNELNICEYTVITFDDVTPGIFMNVTGVLAAKGLQVLDAQIVTRKDGIIVDTFFVADPDYEGEPTTRRLAGVEQAIVKVLKGEEAVTELIQRNRRLTYERSFPFSSHSTEVQVDNETSDHYTIIDVYAEDRQGILYVMARSIFNLGLSVHAARISTRLDQIVDVFYVTSGNGLKLEDATMCEKIRTTLKGEVDEFLERPAGQT